MRSKFVRKEIKCKAIACGTSSMCQFHCTTFFGTKLAVILEMTIFITCNNRVGKKHLTDERTEEHMTQKAMPLSPPISYPPPEKSEFQLCYNMDCTV